MSFALRPMVPSDTAFVYSNWLRELREVDRSPLPDDIWFPAHRTAIDRALADRATVVSIAGAPDDPNEILGFAAGVPNEVLHWVHVLRVFRGKGLPLVPALLQAVGCPPGTPAAWQHPNGRSLRNPPRPRASRRFYGATSPSGSIGTSPSRYPASPAAPRPPGI